MSIFNKKAVKIFLGYAILFYVVFTCMVAFILNAKVNDFLTSMENKTFDLRQTVLVGSHYKKPSKDIVIITVDDASYEYLLQRFGEWPIPRDIYAGLIDYLEKQNPRVIAFDYMFVKSLKSKNNADMALTNAINRYKNVYVSMNFDNESFDLRQPVKLPDRLSVNVKNDSAIDLSNLSFTNCRVILPQLIKGTKNIGIINVIRDNDGILRKMPPFLVYQKNFYPHLALMVGLKALNKNSDIKSFYVNKNSDLRVFNRNIPLDSSGGVILNWYGPANQSFTQIPFYKVLKAIEGNKKILNYDFKDKIIYVGVTATSLYDTKSVPVDKIYPGVGLHATFVNNLLDNNFIKRVSPSVDIVTCCILAILIGILAFRIQSSFVSLVTTILITVSYVIFTYYMMKFFNLWLAVIMPVIVIFVAFATTYIIKYILKSRDFEHQYKLATTDGLTDLYNHRFFQEQMIMQVANCKRYNTNFSLIIIDIDFFKKFNDTFGHQSGDAVLRQVSYKLKKNVRATDFVCRYGGEEMTIILPNTDKDEAIITAQKICQIIAEKSFKLANNQESNVTISVGVATYPQDGDSADKIIEHADKCLYFAKENGRNQVKW
jgi:diguanylate cyclase (GGDEF)-like protein